MRTHSVVPLALALAVFACKKDAPGETASAPAGTASKSIKVGLVTDVGGRGDGSFNDSALRGLELWVAGKRYTPSGYVAASDADFQKTLPEDLRSAGIRHFEVAPVVLHSKAQEDYEPNLSLLVDDGAKLAIGVGFMLENAVEAAAKLNPSASFLLIDSPVLDADGKPYSLPNVRTVTFREQEGSFLVGALAGLVTKTGKVGFVGGMELPLIKKFEAGFRAGVKAVNPKAYDAMLIAYTGSFDNAQTGKQVGQDLLKKGADVVFQAAGADGLGVIAAVKEAGKWAIGVDSDQEALAPGTILTSMVKRVDLAVWTSVRDLLQGTFKGGDLSFGLKEGGVGYAPVRVDFPGKAEALVRVEALRKQIVEGAIQVPATLAELASFRAPAPSLGAAR